MNTLPPIVTLQIFPLPYIFYFLGEKKLSFFIKKPSQPATQQQKHFIRPKHIKNPTIINHKMLSQGKKIKINTITKTDATDKQQDLLDYCSSCFPEMFLTYYFYNIIRRSFHA